MAVFRIDKTRDYASRIYYPLLYGSIVSYRRAHCKSLVGFTLTFLLFVFINNSYIIINSFFSDGNMVGDFAAYKRMCNEKWFFAVYYYNNLLIVHGGECLYSDGAPRPLADKLSAGRERKTRECEAGLATCGQRRTNRIMRLPYSYSPSVQPLSGGEASQAIGRVAREPREGEIPVELSQAAIRSAYFIFRIE